MPSYALAASFLLLGSVDSSQSRQPHSECVRPVVRREPSDGAAMADFCARIAAYARLRGELQEDLPAAQVTDDVAQIRHFVRALATQIRASQQRPREGGIFTTRAADEIRRRLRLVATVDTCRTIMDDNPGHLSRPVSRDYPEGRPRSTTPATVLAIVPRLPPDIEYRFVGPDLILLDTRANIVVDRIAGAIRCGYRDRDPLEITSSTWRCCQSTRAPAVARFTSAGGRREAGS